MANIKKIYAYEVIDSRGFPTIEGKLTLDNNRAVITAVPAGTSIGKYEAVELRDNDPNRFDGYGVSRAVKFINEVIGPKLVGTSPLKQQEIDAWLVSADGTKNKAKLGANTTLTISQLLAKAAAEEQGIPLFAQINLLYKTLFKTEIPLKKIPTPIFNIINGGKHANNNLELQEFQVIPSSSLNFGKAYETGVGLYHELKRVLEYRNANISVGEEGGFAPNLSSNIDAFELLNETIIRKNLRVGLDVFLGVDFAASHYFNHQKYTFKEKPQPLSPDDYLNFLIELSKQYKFLIFEDPLDEDDFKRWAKLNSAIPKELYLVGDDLLATSKERFLEAIKQKACSTILVKPNQIGTITETLEVIDIARKNDFNYVVSHRSGETNDSFIADFAVGIQADFVKFGAPSRGERIAKYNRLWQIEREELK